MSQAICPRSDKVGSDGGIARRERGQDLLPGRGTPRYAAEQDDVRPAASRLECDLVAMYGHALQQVQQERAD
jgi:hypothetical protein